MQGTDLRLIANKNNAADRQDFFYEHTFMGSPGLPKVEGVVSRELKYMKFIEYDYEELYDLKNDPHETTNLAREISQQALMSKMRARYEELKEKVK
jgi:arylsulfatase A-like enzyme